MSALNKNSCLLSHTMVQWIGYAHSLIRFAIEIPNPSAASGVQPGI